MLNFLKYFFILIIVLAIGYYLFYYNNNLNIDNAIKVIMFIVLIITILGFNFLLYYKKIMKVDIKELKSRKPNFLLYYFLVLILYPIFKIKNNVKYDKSKIRKAKGPFLVLSNHPSKPDFLYAGSLILPKKMIAVADRSLFYNKKTKFLLTALGTIPKSLFTSDVQTIKLIIEAARKKNNILMMPEGRLSTTNINDKITFSTAKLIKKLNITVIGINISGAYYNGGKWVRNKRRGKIYVKADVICKKEDLSKYSEEQIDNLINEALKCDDNLFIKENNIHFKGTDLIDNLNTILYKCPKCHSEFAIVTKDNKLKCEACDLELDFSTQCEFIDKSGNIFEYNTVSKWHNFQKECEKKNISNDDFVIEDYFDLYVQSNKDKEYKFINSGKCLYNKDEFKFIAEDGYTLSFKASSMPALAFVCNMQLEIYYKEFHYCFRIKGNELSLIKWATMVECNYNHRFINK